MRSFINFLFREFNLSVDFHPRDHLSAWEGGKKEKRGKMWRSFGLPSVPCHMYEETRLLLPTKVGDIERANRLCV